MGRSYEQFLDVLHTSGRHLMTDEQIIDHAQYDACRRNSGQPTVCDLLRSAGNNACRACLMSAIHTLTHYERRPDLAQRLEGRLKTG